MESWRGQLMRTYTPGAVELWRIYDWQVIFSHGVTLVGQSDPCLIKGVEGPGHHVAGIAMVQLLRSGHLSWGNPWRYDRF
jgi:hypothetical protein